MRPVNQILIAVAAAAAIAGAAGAERPAKYAHGGHVALDEALSVLRADFNAEAGKVRLLFIVGPTCAVCLRGLDDMDKVVGDLTRSDDRVAAFVVHVPTLGAEKKDVDGAARLFHGRNIRHYWDASGAIGLDYQEVLALTAGDKGVFAWDVWMIFDPEARWPDEGAPAPAHWEHQLSSLRETHPNYLDAARFAEKARSLVKAARSDD